MTWVVETVFVIDEDSAFRNANATIAVPFLSRVAPAGQSNSANQSNAHATEPKLSASQEYASTVSPPPSF